MYHDPEDHERAKALQGALQGCVVIVGASAGGWSARLFASTPEERVVGLVLVNAQAQRITVGVSLQSGCLRTRRGLHDS